MNVSRRQFTLVLSAVFVPKDGRRGTPHVYDLRGTAYEVGFQHGKALAAEIRAEAQPHFEKLGDGGKRVVSRYEGLFRERFPWVIEEIQGIADGAKLRYPYAFFAATRDGMSTGACTAMACSGRETDGGQPLIGQNKDTDAPLDRFRILRIAYASGRRMIVLNYPGWIANLCLTSDGMSFTGNSLYAAAPDRATVPASFLKRLVMEKRSTAEFLDAMKGLVSTNGCYLVGDRSGHMISMEMVAGRASIRDVSGQAFGHANDILHSDVKKFEAAGKPASSLLRQKNIQRILRGQAGRISVASLQHAFSNHEDYPLSICRHPSPLDPTTTNASFIADLRALEMHIAIGNPCIAPYVKYELPV